MATPKVTARPELLDLDPRWEMAINAELDGGGVVEVAAKVGVTRKTLWQWREIEEFQAARRVLQQERRGVLLARVEASGDVGLATLIEICKHGENEGARVAAARVLVERALGPAPQRVEMEHSGEVKVEVPYPEEVAALRARLTA